jgi:hypothetical protein
VILLGGPAGGAPDNERVEIIPSPGSPVDLVPYRARSDLPELPRANQEMAPCEGAGPAVMALPIPEVPR